MAQKDSAPYWDKYIAVTTAVIAVLAAITSLYTNSTTSLILLEKNNSNQYQAKANKEWNYFLAHDITDRVTGRLSDQAAQQTFQQQAEELERQAEEATVRANTYFEKNGHLTTAGTFFEIAIALSAMAVLVKRRTVWMFSLLLVVVGGYFLLLGFA